jgi:hypothetical protein
MDGTLPSLEARLGEIILRFSQERREWNNALASKPQETEIESIKITISFVSWFHP